MADPDPQDQPPDDPLRRLHELVRALCDPETWRRLQEQARVLRDPEAWRRVQEQARVLSDPASWKRAQEQARLLSDPETWRRVQEQARVLSDPASWKRAHGQARVLSDPAAWKRAHQQARTLTDPETWRRVQDEARRLSDPAHWERARADLRLLTDPTAIRSAEAHAAGMQAALRRLQDQVAAATDGKTLDEIRAATPSEPEAANNLKTEARYWAEEVAGVAGLDPAFFQPGDVLDEEFAWVGVLPSLVQMKLLAQSLSVLNMILLAAATMGVAAVPLVLVLAAEVLIRLIDALLTYLGGDER